MSRSAIAVISWNLAPKRWKTSNFHYWSNPHYFPYIHVPVSLNKNTPKLTIQLNWYCCNQKLVLTWNFGVQKGNWSMVKPSAVFFKNELAEVGASRAVSLDVEEDPWSVLWTSSWGYQEVESKFPLPSGTGLWKGNIYSLLGLREMFG